MCNSYTNYTSRTQIRKEIKNKYFERTSIHRMGIQGEENANKQRIISELIKVEYATNSSSPS